MRTFLRGKVTLLFMMLGLLLAIPAVAWAADNVISDGDGLAPIVDSNIAAGSVPCNSPTDKTVLLALRHQGGTNNVFKNGSTVTVSVQSVTGSGLSASMGSPNTIALPSTWEASANGTQSASVSATVTINPTVTGAGSGTVTYQATGTEASSGGSLTRTDTQNVTWTAGSCDSTAPSVTSISTADANPTNTTGNLHWTVTFSENVTGVDTGDFALDNSGLSGSPAITSVAQGANASVYTVTASSGSGTGTLGLNLNDNDSIKDAALNPLGGTGTGVAGGAETGNGSFAGDDYVIDRTAPTVTATAFKGPDFTDPYTADTWTNKDVRVTFTCADTGDSGLTSTSGNQVKNFTANTTQTGATATFDGTCADNAGNTAAASNFGPIKIDKDNPVISGADIIQTAWRNTPLSASFTASDALSGLANLADASFTLATSGDSPNATTPVTASKTVSDNAGNSATRTISAFVDTVKPVISGADVNNTTWRNTDLSASFTASDALSGLANLADASFTLTTSGESPDPDTPVTATKTVSDKAGNSSTRTISALVDKTDPNVNCGSADTNWHAADVSIPCTASDGLSGLADNANDASFNLSTSVANGTETSSAETNSRNVLDNAGNSKTAGPISPIKVDKKAPTFSDCTGGPFTQGSGSHSVSITATDGGSGMDNPNSTLSGSVDTNTIGAKTFTFTAKDNVANSDTKVCSYDVDYNFSGFFQPVDNKDSNGNYILNKAKAGSVVPVKFSLGSDQGLNVLASGYPQTASIPCTASSSDVLEEYGTGSVSSFKYDPVANQYIYNWKTDTKWAGTCRQLVVKLADDTYHRANFNFFK